MSKISENLKAIRKEKGITRQAVSSSLGIPYQTLYNYESGISEPPGTLLTKLAEYYNCNVEDILGIEKVENQKETSPVSEEAVYQFLLDTGIVNPGEDLSDEDLEMLSATLQLLAVYFRNRKA